MVNPKDELKLEAAQRNLLGRIKEQYNPGPMRPRLYQSLPPEGAQVDLPLTFQWMYYAGMGDVGFHPATAEEATATEQLILKGDLVPTFEQNFYGIERIQHVQHFDDVKFGMDPAGNIVAYDFALNGSGENNPDPFLTADKIHPSAINKITSRMDFSVASHAVKIDPDAIQLIGGPVVRPILTNADLIEMRRRQRVFKAE